MANKRIKKVFTTSMVFHVFAQQTQEDGRTAKVSSGQSWSPFQGGYSDGPREGSSRVFFEKDTIYSYGKHYWLGKIIKDKNVCLINSQKSSVTTENHKNMLLRAVTEQTFYVPSNYDHRQNIEYLNEGWLKELEISFRCGRPSNLGMKENFERAKNWALAHREDALKYAKLFPFGSINYIDEIPFDRINKELERREKLDAKYNTPENLLKRQKAKLSKEKNERKKKIKQTRKAVKTFIGGDYAFIDPILLRISSDNTEIQTSQGASMPVSFAKLIWQTVCKCKAEKTTFKANGKTIKAGLFSIQWIDQEGTVKAGCHTIKYGPIKSIARQLNFI